MADSTDNNSASDDFADDLDAMLNDVSTTDGELDEIIDDEDAIDRLLMDDSLIDSDSTDNSIIETEADEFAEIDEFVEDSTPVDEPVSAETPSEDDEFDVDDLISSSTEEVSSEQDEFAEIDEFAEDLDITEPEQAANAIEDAMESTITEPDDSAETNETSEAPETSEVDMLMANFDISDDDDDDDFSEAPTEIQDNLTEQSAEVLPLPIPPVAPAVNTEEIAKTQTAIDEINAQISQLWADNEELKKQLTELADTARQNNLIADEIETLQSEQRKLKKSQKASETKAPVMSYIALGIAILALLVGSGLGFIGFSAQSEVTELTEIVATLEEEIEILAAKDSSKDIKKMNARLNALTKKEAIDSAQLKKINEALKTPSLKPIVDDLVVQNDHAQQAIETLLAKVETLEKRKQVIAKAKKVKKIAPKVTWVVNLVSFKQEWYANRKASEFDKKGIPAEVMKVKVNGETWFRLTVKGFKTKYEAAAYAVKVKKTLNLSSTWVTKA